MLKAIGFFLHFMCCLGNLLSMLIVGVIAISGLSNGSVTLDDRALFTLICLHPCSIWVAAHSIGELKNKQNR